MKAISIWEPYASLIADRLKRFETRSWATRYRGPLLICSAKHRIYDVQRAVVMSTVWKYGSEYDYLSLPFGQALCVVDLEDCMKGLAAMNHMRENYGWDVAEKEFRLGNFLPGRFGFLCANVRRFKEPWPIIGRQRLFNVPDELINEHELEDGQ